MRKRVYAYGGGDDDLQPVTGSKFRPFIPNGKNPNPYNWIGTNTEVPGERMLPPVTVTNTPFPKRKPVNAAVQGIPRDFTMPEPNFNGGVKDITAGMPRTQTSKPNGKNVFSKFGDIVPYISNIANSFRRVPLPDAPGYISPVTARRVNFDAQRAEADRMMRGVNSNVDKTLDENTGAAVKATNLASNIRGKNSISENESNTNAQLQMEADRTNAAIDMQNVGLKNQWKRDLVEAQVAQQREQSQNLSNAADKYVGQQNVKSQEALDKAKWEALQPMWQNSGVSGRAFGKDSEFAIKLKASNPDLYKQMYGEFAYGGKMSRRKVFSKC